MRTEANFSGHVISKIEVAGHEDTMRASNKMREQKEKLENSKTFADLNEAYTKNQFHLEEGESVDVEKSSNNEVQDHQTKQVLRFENDTVDSPNTWNHSQPWRKYNIG